MCDKKRTSYVVKGTRSSLCGSGRARRSLLRERFRVWGCGSRSLATLATKSSTQNNARRLHFHFNPARFPPPHPELVLTHV